ncbi:MAG: RES family NAD+ phosphorylase [Gemmatimonadales bacterium]
MSQPALTAWRCYPWDPTAPDGAPFSSSYLIPGQTVGRFDLHDRPPARYLAESPEHAIGEMLGPFRGTRFRPAYLRQGGRQLALVEVTLASTLVARIADCTDPEVLTALGLRPDELAHHDRAITQAIARRLHDLGGTTGKPAGLRWWSALTGAWHTVVVFTDRERAGEVAFGAPRELRASDPEVGRALSVLGVRTR